MATGGIPFAPVSPAYSLVSKDHAKLKDIAALLKPGAIFADDGAAFAPAIDAISTSDCTVINQRKRMSGAIGFDILMQGDASVTIGARAAVTGDTVVKYLFTSGSTGSPKAVINTNAMICAMEAMDDGKPAPGKIDETIRNLREVACTWYFNVPVGWDILVDALEKDVDLAETFFSRLGMMFYAGAGMAQHTWDRLRAIGRKSTGREVLLATSLGATETAPAALACTDVQDMSGNVGVPMRGLSMKLVPTGGKLALRLKGPSITPGYFGDADKTAEAFDDEGYYMMGDALRPADPDDLAKGFIFDGRIAENFKLNTGTWVAVGAVRAGLVDAMGGLIRDAVITGENEGQVGALLLLSDKATESRVRRALILDDVPSFDRGEITEKGSLNQRAMRANNADAIVQLYEGGDGVIEV